MDDVELILPAKPEFLHLMRSVVASLGARRDLSIDEIDDLRIAVDEAGSYLLSNSSGAANLKLRVTSERDDVTVVMWLEIQVADWPPPGSEDALAWKVMSGLADTVEFIQLDGSPGIKLAKFSARGVNV